MVTRLSGGLTPGDGADPRTFPAIWNATAETIESQGTAITGLQSDAVLYAGTAVPVDGNVLTYSTAIPGWTAGVGGGGGASVTIGTAAPGSPSDGDMWWNSTDGNLYLYYTDVDSSQWVAANGPQVLVSEVAPNGYQGQLWFDSTQGKVFIYYDDGSSGQFVSAIGGSLAGSVLQVVSTTKTDTFSTTSTTFTDVTGLSATITPRSTNSKIYAVVTANIAASGAGVDALTQLVRDSTAIGNGVGGSLVNAFGHTNGDSPNQYATHNTSINYLDSPATTSSVTYKVQMRTYNTGTAYLNRRGSGADFVTSSSITLMEIAG